MTHKKVLINGSMLTKNVTGVGVQNVHLLNYLIPKLCENDIDVTVYCYDNSKILKFDSFIAIKNISLGKYFDKFLLKYPAIHRMIWNLFFLKKVARSYDLTYSPSSYGFIGKGKQLITIHDLIAINLNAQYKSQQLYFKYIIPLILKNNNRVICISHFTAEEVIKNYKKTELNKLVVIPNGIDHVRDNSSVESDEYVDTLTHYKNFCLCVGVSYYNKNISTIIEVANKLKDENLFFIFVGKVSNYLNAMKQKANALGLENVIFLEYVDDATLSSLYKKCRLHLYLSLYEGFGFPPGEAAYYGTPSLISSQKALLEVYGKYIRSIDPINVNDIASVIVSEFKNDKVFDKSVFNHIKIKYNWEDSAEKVKNLIIGELKT